MSYLARLVQQSGLRVAAPMARVPVQGGLPDAPEGVAEGIEEIRVEVPVSAPPARAADVPPVPPVAVSEAGEAQVAPPPRVSEAPEAAGEGAPVPEVPEAERATPDVHREMPPVADAGEVGRKDERPAPDPEVQRTITRHKTLRRVFEWIAPNDMRPEVAEPEPVERKPVEAAEPPVERTVYLTPETDGGEGTPARVVGPPEDAPEPAPAPRAVEVIERAEPATPERTPRPEPVEERVDISIGAINVTVEAPPQPAPQPVTGMPVPPQPAPTPPAPRRAPRPTSGRLRRRFIRL